MTTSIATVIAAAANYDLAYLSDAKDELLIPLTDTTKDAFLTRSITQVSNAASEYCNRIFQVEQLSEVVYLDSDLCSAQYDRSSVLQLSRWPFLSVLSVTEDVGMDDVALLVLGTDYLVVADKGQLIRLDSDTGLQSNWALSTVTVSYVAGFGSLASESSNIPGSPFQITVKNASTFSIDQGVVFSSTNIPLVKVTGVPSTGQYAVSTSGATIGQYTFAAADTGSGVTISYGYNQIPGSATDALMRLVTQRFRARGRDPMLMERQSQGPAGTERFWVGAAPGQNGGFPPEIASLLDSYRVPTVA